MYAATKWCRVICQPKCDFSKVITKESRNTSQKRSKFTVCDEYGQYFLGFYLHNFLAFKEISRDHFKYEAVDESPRLATPMVPAPPLFKIQEALQKMRQKWNKKINKIKRNI